MATLSELDRPHAVDSEYQRLEDERGEQPGWEVTAPSFFPAMTWEQQDAWPTRQARRWILRRLLWTALGPIAGGCVAWFGWPLYVSIGVAGFTLDAIGIFLLAESVLLSDDDARFVSTWAAMPTRHLNQSQGETRRVDAVGLTESEPAARARDGRLAHSLETG
jgi:hypothetical protein